MANIMPARKYAEHVGLPYKRVLELAKVDGFPALRIGEKRVYILPEQAAEWFKRKAQKPLG